MGVMRAFAASAAPTSPISMESEIESADFAAAALVVVELVEGPVGGPRSGHSETPCAETHLPAVALRSSGFESAEEEVYLLSCPSLVRITTTTANMRRRTRRMIRRSRMGSACQPPVESASVSVLRLA